MEDKRIPAIQEKLEQAVSKLQDLHIQATAGNISNFYEAITNLQVVYNTLTIMRNECRKTDGGENGREADIK